MIPKSDVITSSSSLEIEIRRGAPAALLGRFFTFKPQKLTRLKADGPLGVSFLLETLSALCRREIAPLSDWHWPPMHLDSGQEASSISGARPCVLIAQDRFDVQSDQIVADILGLGPLLKSAHSHTKQSARCQFCGKSMKIPSLPDLAAFCLERLASFSVILVLASCIAPNARQRRAIATMGYNRFLVKGDIVDGDDLEASGLWGEVQAVLVDALKPRMTARDRLLEALHMAAKIGENHILLVSDANIWPLDLALPVCLYCQTPLFSQVLAGQALPDLCVSELKKYWQEAIVDKGSGDSLIVSRIFSLLERFSLGHISLSRRISDYNRQMVGLLELIKGISQGGDNRFVLIDSLAESLTSAQAEVLYAIIRESLTDGWGWIVGGDNGLVTDLADETIDLELQTKAHTVEPYFTTLSSPGDWQGRVLLNLGEYEVGSGRWIEIVLNQNDEQPWEYKGFTQVPPPARESERIVVQIAKRHLAWKLSNSRRRSLASFIGWDRILADRLAEMPLSKARGLSASRILGRTALDRCPRCHGSGYEWIESMTRLESICVLCQGVGGRSDMELPRYRARSIYDIMAMTIHEAVDFFLPFPRLAQEMVLAVHMGLGLLPLRQGLRTLSASERWLLVLLAQATKLKQGGLWMIQEPFLGLSARQQGYVQTVLAELLARGVGLVTISRRACEVDGFERIRYEI